jgi:hypothetical protein
MDPGTMDLNICPSRVFFPVVLVPLPQVKWVGEVGEAGDQEAGRPSDVPSAITPRLGCSDTALASKSPPSSLDDTLLLRSLAVESRRRRSPE